MLMAVPARIGGVVAEPKIGRQIDHLGRRRLRQQLLHHLLRGGVRQRAERDVEPRLSPVEPFDGDQLRQIVGRELREYVAHRLAGAALGGEQHDVGARVAQQHAHKFCAGITGGAEYADFRFGGHLTILIQSLKELPDQGQQRGCQEKKCRGQNPAARGRFYTRKRARAVAIRRRRRLAGANSVVMGA